METSTSVTEEISKGLELSIMSTGPEYNLDEPIHAINWFDVKYGWLYDFYNKLVISHVIKVGGRPLLKGKLIKTLLGTEEDMRQVILVVKYPGAQAFINMVKSKVFQAKSILRVTSVLNFTFGFMKRLNTANKGESKAQHYSGKLLYLVHHFRDVEKVIPIDEINGLALEQDVFTKFIGMKCALVGRKQANEKLRTAPFPMDGLLVFAAFEESQFKSLIDTDAYKAFIASNKSNYIGIYNRKY